ncbi:hypothetical protein, partial [uncultured Helicobacter sp.]|uniref:hypothetical protein n=1 Tax=uncultured Helicobacter sp. TaxID=175537 RepID=UPI00272952E5
ESLIVLYDYILHCCSLKMMFGNISLNCNIGGIIESKPIQLALFDLVIIRTKCSLDCLLTPHLQSEF